MQPDYPRAFWDLRRVNTPAVQAEWSITCRGEGTWLVTAVKFVLTTDANVANRLVSLVVDDGTDEYMRAAYEGNFTAGATWHLGAYPGANRDPATLSAANVALPAGGLLLRPGSRLRTVSTALQAGDAYSAIRVMALELPTGPNQRWTPTVDTLVSSMES